jgi:hypothetical protein
LQTDIHRTSNGSLAHSRQLRFFSDCAPRIRQRADKPFPMGHPDRGRRRLGLLDSMPKL